MKKNNIAGIIFSTIIFLGFNCSSEINQRTNIFIRVNQVGFETIGYKEAVILSNTDLSKERIEIVKSNDNTVMFTVPLIKSSRKYSSYPYCYNVGFSKLEIKGSYKIRIKGIYSGSFKIADNIYKNISRKLLKFFKIQRCGYTDPELHEECHIADATYYIENGDTISSPIDLTGGWHDAGDYVKLLSTTAYATYTLLFAYDFDRRSFEFDDNQNSVPDVLEEAKIGLDWMLRCNFEKFKLVTQVQDLRDHDVGWRLPENDTLKFDRPAFVGIGKNIIGLYTATMALASRIWADRFDFTEFSEKCLTAAENLYSIHRTVKDIDNSTNGIYQDVNFHGKIALGAIELYEITKRPELLEDAKEYATIAGPNYWWSYGEISDYAFYRIAKYDSSFVDLIKTSLVHFENQKNKRLFKTGTPFYWGSNHTLLGISLKQILWAELTGKNKFKTLADNQINYVLGQNPWGISFITRLGSYYSKNFHHQVSHLKGVNLPGGFAAGPVQKEILDQYDIEFEKEDKYLNFQTDSAYYRDDRMDYVSNEPTIIANATGILVFGTISKNK